MKNNEVQVLLKKSEPLTRPGTGSGCAHLTHPGWEGQVGTCGVGQAPRHLQPGSLTYGRGSLWLLGPTLGARNGKPDLPQGPARA
jgi:hypothetical protein